MDHQIIGLDLLVNNRKVKNTNFKNQNNNIEDNKNIEMNTNINLNNKIKDEIIDMFKNTLSKKDNYNSDFLNNCNIDIDQLIDNNIQNLIDLIKLKYTHNKFLSKK